MVKGKEFCFGCSALPENRQRGFLLVLCGAVSQSKLKKEIADHITFINSPLGLLPEPKFSALGRRQGLSKFVLKGDRRWVMVNGVNLDGENGNICAGIWGIYRLAGCENPQTRHPRP